jgi:hypothetical protein
LELQPPGHHERMFELAKAADRLLRGKWAAREELARGRIAAGVATLIGVGLASGAIYGVAMGLFGLLRPAHATWKQALANSFKVPLLFLLTLAVAFPSLYAFSALADSKLRMPETLKLLLVAVAIDLVLLASFAPVTAFFTVSTTSYAFMVLLNVLFFAISGLIGLAVLGKTLRTVFDVPERPMDSANAIQGVAETPAAEAARWKLERDGRARFDRANRVPRRIFLAWFAIYGFVGSQMGWILRPFVGTPGLEFQLFRPRGGNFFEGVATALYVFLSGR